MLTEGLKNKIEMEQVQWIILFITTTSFFFFLFFFEARFKTITIRKH